MCWLHATKRLLYPSKLCRYKSTVILFLTIRAGPVEQPVRLINSLYDKTDDIEENIQYYYSIKNFCTSTE